MLLILIFHNKKKKKKKKKKKTLLHNLNLHWDVLRSDNSPPLSPVPVFGVVVLTLLYT